MGASFLVRRDASITSATVLTRDIARRALAVSLLMLLVSRGVAAEPALPCAETLAAAQQPLEIVFAQHGSTVRQVDLASHRGQPLLVAVHERGIDVELEVQDSAGHTITRFDSPVERQAWQYAELTSGHAASVLWVTAKDPPGLTGEVRIRLLVPSDNECSLILTQWARADMRYAAGRAITVGRVKADTGAARADFEAAGDGYRSVYERLQSNHAHERAALELNLAALLYDQLQDWGGSAEWAAKAATSFGYLGERYARARAQAIQAAAWMELATRSQSAALSSSTPQRAHQDLDRARRILRALVTFHRERREPYDEALQINNIGLAYFYEARFEAAVPYFLSAQTVFESFRDASRSALALQNLALCQWGMGELAAALKAFDRALALENPSANPNAYLLTLNNDGLAHYAAGRLDEALRLQNQALDFAERTQSDRARARSDYGLGVTYYAIGDRALAADFLQRALQLATAALDARIRVASLRALAQLEHETGKPAQATAHDREALALATAASARARILLRLAEDESETGDTGEAQQILDDLIRFPPGRDALVRAMAESERGELLRRAHRYALARADLSRAIPTFKRFDSLDRGFDARVRLARVYADEGCNDCAIRELRQALARSEEIRAQTANPEYRSSIVESLRPALALEVELLRARFEKLTQAKDHAGAERAAREGLEAVDRYRASAFEDWQSESLEGSGDDSVQPLLTQRSALYHEMAERRYQLAVREDRAGTTDERARILREDLAQLEVKLGLLTAEIARRSHGSSHSTSRRSALDASGGRASIEYWLGPEHAYAWVLQGSDLLWFDLGTSEPIERAARAWHEALRAANGRSAATRVASDLQRLALAPLMPALHSVEELTLVPDGALHYVPFAALPDPAAAASPSYLIQRFVIAIAPAVHPLRGFAGAAAPRSRVLIVADPIYSPDDARITASRSSSASRDGGHLYSGGETPRLSRLESSANEAAQIRALYRTDDVDLLQGPDATRERLLRQDLGSYRFIHIAAHGRVDAEIPQLSALILSTYGDQGRLPDPYVRAGDLLGKTFHAQAVVFSSCDSALGRSYVTEGLVGLRYVALARGAASVVASLWPVSDAIAAELMTDMYRALPGDRTGGQAVAQALAHSMRSALARTPALDPVLWAPFTVYVGGNVETN